MAENNNFISGRIDESISQTQIKIDKKDKRIISFLIEDCRTPLTKIAKSIRLSRDAVDYRIKRLQRKGLLLGFVPLLHLLALGFRKYHTFLQLNEKKKDRQLELYEYLKSHPNVRSLLEYSSKWDIEFVIVAKNVDEYDEVLTKIEDKFTDVILDKRRMSIIKNYFSTHVPYDFYKDFSEPLERRKLQNEKIEIDDRDMKIIEMLCKDARVSTYKIGAAIGVSPDTVSIRMKKLKESGIIIRYTTILNLSKIGYNWNTFSIKTESLNIKNQSRIKEFVSRDHNIIRTVRTLGELDIMMYLATDSMSAFHNSIKRIKSEFGDIIKEYRIYAGFKEHVYAPIPKVVVEEYVK